MTASSPLTIMAIHAHPDDETIFTGGTLARYAAQGYQIILVTCTRGEFGEIHDPALDPVADRPRLGAIREGELRKAAEALGIKEIVLLDFHDSNMAGSPDNERSEAFCQQPLTEVTGRIVTLIRHYRPHVLISYDENGGYGHPDHIHAHEATVRAFHTAGRVESYPQTGEPPWQPLKLYYCVIAHGYLHRLYNHLLNEGVKLPINDRSVNDFSTFGMADSRITTTIDTKPFAEAKRQAIYAHRTQGNPDSFLWQMALATTQYGFNDEHYVLAATADGVIMTLPENELFAGLASFEVR